MPIQQTIINHKSVSFVGSDEQLAILSGVFHLYENITPWSDYISCDHLQFEGDAEDLQCIHEDRYLFSMFFDGDKTFKVESDFKTSEISIESMMLFPNFKPLVECGECNGSGKIEGRDCGLPASHCCGGCTVEQECDCEQVIFQIK